MGGATPLTRLRYFYAPSGEITGREVNGREVLENYAYDPAGNILEKTVNGKTTRYEYDSANQLISSTSEGKTVKYSYDSAGRLVKEGNLVYTYKGLDKLTEVTENGKVTGSYTYYAGGQLASATQGGKTESFLWDGLALIARGETGYLNEPALTGGNPIAAGDQVLFNDLLGSTLGRAENGSYTPVAMTAFGETADAGAFFTGKPAVGDLGYTFLFRNYRPTLGKWQTSDPLGYPDGWNNFAYVNNSVTSAIDWLGGATDHIIDESSVETTDNRVNSSGQWETVYTSSVKI